MTESQFPRAAWNRKAMNGLYRNLLRASDKKIVQLASLCSYRPALANRDMRRIKVVMEKSPQSRRRRKRLIARV